MGMFNKLFVIGRLTKAAEATTTPTGTSVVNISLAVSERVKAKEDEYAERANFFDVTFFGNYAKACLNSLTKGREIAVQGKLHQDRWEKDGKKYSRVVIYGEELEILREPKGITEETSAENATPIPTAKEPFEGQF